MANLQDSLSVLMRMLRTHYGKQVILLIDEYDVPLDKANSKLRISKESIFTGLNNLKVDTISDERYDEYFGFTDADV